MIYILPQLGTSITSLLKKASFSMCLLATILLHTEAPLQASHIWGFEVSMECLNNCTVRVHRRVIRDCLGASGAATMSLLVLTSNPSSCPTITAVGPASNTTISDVTPICSQIASACDSTGSPLGVEYHAAYQDFAYCGLPANCQYTFSFSSCCRTYANQVFDANSLGFSQQITLNTGQTTCNNSPVYNSPWQVFLNATPTVIDIGGIDPDGDSLSYALAPCMNALNQVSVYQAGYSGQNPLGPGWIFDLDPITGNLYINSTVPPTGATYICFEISEWRNGVLIGTTTRDMLLFPSFNTFNSQPQFETPQNIAGGISTSRDQFSMCNGDTLVIDFPVSDSDSTGTLLLTWNQGIPNASFSDATTGLPLDTLVGLAPIGRLEFSPTNPGTYFFQLHLEDRNCPLNAISEKTIVIHVAPQSQVFAQVSTCNTVDFMSLTCGGGPFTYQWAGDDGLFGNGPTLSHTYSNPGTYAYQLIITGVSQASDTLRDSITVVNALNVPIIAGPDSLQRCANQVIFLNGLPGFTNFIWSNGQTTSSAQTGSDGWLSVQAETSAGCMVYDSVWIESIPPVYASTIQTNGPTALDQCAGITSITLSTDTTYLSYAWNPGANGPTLIVNQPGTYHFTGLQALGCQVRDSIVITSVPTDISGQVNRLNAGPFPNQKVYLMTYNMGTGNLDFLDSTFTDSGGFYQFCNLSSNLDYNVQVFPNPQSLPFYMPTYADSAMVWNEAFSFPISGPQTIDITALPTSQDMGTSSISGQVIDSITGLPEAGLRIFLTTGTLSEIMGFRDTDANGWFEFTNLPFGTYQVVPDRPFVDHLNVPLVVTSANLPVRDSLDFLLHPTWLELLLPTGLNQPMGMSFTVSPHPVTDQAFLELELPYSESLKVEVVNLNGQVISPLWEGDLPTGLWRYSWSPQLASGTYLIRIRGKHTQLIKRVFISPQ